ncbi:hypothetical protein FA13DRAFT_1038640 [Coprinellus micaceus]|uniref:RNI-like protein n=1 Tax=Coprinellus micaceus TaxID=71717 RepID=A0A4Y7SX75_COPMI|nr:hypothetical protein FA13DRAFT_1038640 [Coprinellus micaceus]
MMMKVPPYFEMLQWTGHCKDPRPTSTDARAATGDAVVDLSKRHLSSEIFAILKEAELFSRLDVSHNPAVDNATLLQLLQEHRLEWVNIDGCSVSNKDMVGLLKSHPSLSRGIEAIIHPAFLSVNSLGVSKGTPVAFSLLYKGLFRTRRYALPFFGVDQIVQNLLDAAAALKSFEYVGNTPMPCDMQSLFAASHRSGRPWATRDIQTIPLQTESRDLAKGYTLVVLPQLYDKLIPSPRGGFQFEYGISPPGGKRKFIDVATFLEYLERDGWPEPKDEKAVEQVIKAYNEGGSLLVDFDSTVKELADLMTFAAMVEALDKRQSPQSHDDLGSFSFRIPRFFLVFPPRLIPALIFLLNVSPPLLFLLFLVTCIASLSGCSQAKHWDLI